MEPRLTRARKQIRDFLHFFRRPRNQKGAAGIGLRGFLGTWEGHLSPQERSFGAVGSVEIFQIFRRKPGGGEALPTFNHGIRHCSGRMGARNHAETHQETVQQERRAGANGEIRTKIR